MNILFLGGDQRYKYMMEDLSNNLSVYQIGFKNENPLVHNEELDGLNLGKFDIIVFPISGINENFEIKTEKGSISLPKSLFSTLNSNTLVFTGLKTEALLSLIPESQIISFLDNKEVEKINNNLTIDGTLDAIKNMKKDNICILGYGTLGKELYWRLNNDNIRTFIISRPKELIYKDKVQNYYPLNSQNILEVFKFCDIAINTIPYNIIPEDAISAKHVPYILDIASFPYGIDQNIIKKYKDHVEYNLYLGIPSKYAPKTASKILLKTLKEVTKI